MDLTLARDKANAEPRFGLLSFGAPYQLQTLEPGAEDADAKDVPPGKYSLALHDTPTHPKTFALVNPELGVFHEKADVPEDHEGPVRVAVLVHPGNREADTRGCVLVGMSRGELDGEPAVLESVYAFARFKGYVPWVEGHTLTITEPAAAE